MLTLWTCVNRLCTVPCIWVAQAKSVLACVAGRISMGVLYCYGGGATRRVGKSQFGFSFQLCRS